MKEDTIVAIATPPGRGGVAILRLSGSKACSIGLHLSKKKSVLPRNVNYCSFYDKNSCLIDQGLLIYFKAPHSFTGDDVIELQVHGAPFVLDQLLEECVALGARLAKPGEFSERAFLNNKIDLIQAEAIADLIQAHSQTAARMAVRSLQGDFSNRIKELNEKLIHLRLYVEAAIDFPEEEIDFLSDGKIATMLGEVTQKLDDILANAVQGSMLREGLSVVIAGRPNAGKSTLINCLAGREVAIVTPIAGTTRDVMREHILLDDIPLHLIDTAGLRESEDVVEKEGIARAWQEVRRADCLLMVIDASEPSDELWHLNSAIEKELPAKVPIIRIYNKIDQLDPACLPTQKAKERNTLFLSAKTGQGIPSLKSKIKEIVGYQPLEGQFLARRRHLQSLNAAKELLKTGQNQLFSHQALELLAEDLRLAQQALSEITGEFSSDDLLGRIFSSFCIGK